MVENSTIKKIPAVSRIVTPFVALFFLLTVFPHFSHSSLGKDSVGYYQDLLSDSRKNLNEGNFSAATSKIEELIKNFPTNAIYLQQLALIHNKSGDSAKEAAAWEAYFEKASSPSEACPQIGLAYRKAGLKEQALGAFERCRKLEPRNSDFLFFLSEQLERNGKFDEAIEFYKMGQLLNNTNLDFKIGIARVLYFQNKTAEALPIIEDVVKNNPNTVDALLVNAQVLRSKGVYTESIKLLKHAIEISPKYATLHLLAAKVLDAQQKFSEALQEYKILNQLSPGSPDIIQDIERLERLGGTQ